ncbi:unnamed protein product, partial [Cuscuta europaea]
MRRPTKSTIINRKRANEDLANKENVDHNVHKRSLHHHNGSSNVLIDRTNVSLLPFNRSSSVRTMNISNKGQCSNVCLPDYHHMCDEVSTHIQDELPSQSHQVEVLHLPFNHSSSVRTTNINNVDQCPDVRLL